MGFLGVHKCQIAAEQRESDGFILENLEEKEKALNQTTSTRNDSSMRRKHQVKLMMIDHLSHGFRTGGWLSGKSKNSLNVTGSYISERKIRGQKLLGAKCLCRDVFTQHKAGWLRHCGCFRILIACASLQLTLSAAVALHFLLLLSWLHLFSLYFFPPLILL